MFFLMKRQSCYNYLSGAACAHALQNQRKALCLLHRASAHSAVQEEGRKGKHISADTPAKGSLRTVLLRRDLKSECIWGQSQSALKHPERKGDSSSG